MTAKRGRVLGAVLSAVAVLAFGRAVLGQGFGGSVRFGTAGMFPGLGRFVSPSAGSIVGGWDYGSVRAGGYNAGIPILPTGYLPALPSGYVPINLIGGGTYYGYNNAFYQPAYYGGNMVYAPVSPPYDSGFTPIAGFGAPMARVINGRTYYFYQGSWYRQAYYDGAPTYVLVRGPGQ